MFVLPGGGNTCENLLLRKKVVDTTYKTGVCNIPKVYHLFTFPFGSISYIRFKGYYLSPRVYAKLLDTPKALASYQNFSIYPKKSGCLTPYSRRRRPSFWDFKRLSEKSHHSKRYYYKSSALKKMYRGLF